MPFKVDANQKEIVAALRQAKISVQLLHGVGKGCPDILCGTLGNNILMELKDGNKPPSARKLSKWQQKWHDEWNGQVSIVHSIDEALKAAWKVRR